MIAYVDGSPVLNKVVVCVNGAHATYDIDALLLPVTNNEAEYIAVYKAVLWYPDVTEIASDSQLIINQLRGDWRIHKENLRTFANIIRYLVDYLHDGKMLWTWVSRFNNPAGLHLDKLLKHRKVWL